MDGEDEDGGREDESGEWVGVSTAVYLARLQEIVKVLGNHWISAVLLPG